MDNPLIEYARARVTQSRSTDRGEANKRHRLMTLPIVLLRDEAGMSVRRIAEELGVSEGFVSRVLAHFDYGPPEADPSTVPDYELNHLVEHHTYVEVMAMTGLTLSQIKEKAS